MLGPELRCAVCKAGRCFSHCGCVDHYTEVEIVSRGGSGSVYWRVARLTGHNHFLGQLYREQGDAITILATHHASNPGEAIAQLEASARQLEEQAAELPAGPSTREMEVTGEAWSRAMEFVCTAAKKPITHEKRTELAEEVIAWLRACEREWREAAGRWKVPLWSLEAKQIHDQQVADLFSRLAGAL